MSQPDWWGDEFSQHCHKLDVVGAVRSIANVKYVDPSNEVPKNIHDPTSKSRQWKY